MAYYNLANTYFDLKKYEEAVVCFSHVLRLKPEHVDALFNLGVAHQKVGNNQKALSCYETVTTLDPKNFPEAQEEAEKLRREILISQDKTLQQQQLPHKKKGAKASHLLSLFSDPFELGSSWTWFFTLSNKKIKN
mmetsp:Transcript_15955/g.21096  ORF Transcript_15955/g.21096 Transcript_15955/m.21096 type:complete len:135 (+) Transcript_15955:48-452(+)